MGDSGESESVDQCVGVFVSGVAALIEVPVSVDDSGIVDLYNM